MGDLQFANDRTLFSAWHAMTQALQPVQVFKSIVIPHCCADCNGG